MTNFDALFKSYGIALNKALTIEADRNHYFQHPTWLIPEMISHSIISPMKVNKMQVLTMGAQGIETVSYTHLDVYKRQHPDHEADAR